MLFLFVVFFFLFLHSGCNILSLEPDILYVICRVLDVMVFTFVFVVVVAGVVVVVVVVVGGAHGEVPKIKKAGGGLGGRAERLPPK